MGLDCNVQLKLANLNHNEILLEPITFDDDDPLKGSFSMPADADMGLEIEMDGGD